MNLPPPPPTWAASPPAPPMWPEPERVAPPSALVIGLAAAAGLAFERTVRSTDAGLNVTATLLLANAAVAVAVTTRTRTNVALLSAAAFFAACLAWRATPWIVVPNAVLASVLLGMGASYGRGGSFGVVHPSDVVLRSLAWMGDLVHVPRWLVEAVGRRRPTPDGDAAVEPEATAEHPDGAPPAPWWSRVAGALLAVPVVAVLATLLASADDSFADVVSPTWWATATWSSVLVLGGVWLTASLSRTARRVHTDTPPSAWTADAAGGNVLLGSVAATFTLFAVTRVVSVSSLAARVHGTRGVTWSSEARSGFFQLMAVAAITLVVLLCVRVCCVGGTSRSARLQVRLSILNCALVLVIVGTAVARLWAYQERFGWTMLRLATTISALWFGVVFVIVAAAAWRGRQRSRWLTGALLSSALGVVGVTNLMDPAGLVASSNLTRIPSADTVTLDLKYVLEATGDDGLPAVAEAFGGLSADQRRYVRSVVCPRAESSGWWSFHLARSAADTAAARICNS